MSHLKNVCRLLLSICLAKAWLLCVELSIASVQKKKKIHKRAPVLLQY